MKLFANSDSNGFEIINVLEFVMGTALNGTEDPTVRFSF